MINVNLLPSGQRRPVIQFDRGLAIGLGVLALIVLVIVGYAIWAQIKIDGLKNEIAQVQSEVNQEQVAVQEVYDLRDQAEQLRAKADRLERIKQSPRQLAEILQDLANSTPRGVWFTVVGVSRGTSGGGVSLQGRASALREVADLMLNLDGSPVFGDAQLASATQTTAGGLAGGGNVSFNVNGVLSAAVIGQ